MIALGGPVVVVATVGLVRPWQGSTTTPETWSPLTTALPAGVDLPTEAEAVEIEGGLLTSSTRRLVESAIDSYRTGGVLPSRPSTTLRQSPSRCDGPGGRDRGGARLRPPRQHRDGPRGARGRRPRRRHRAARRGRRHVDGLGVGGVQPRVAGRGLLAFEERYLVTGNHDHGSFVAGQAADLGFTVMDAEVVEAADDIGCSGRRPPLLRARELARGDRALLRRRRRAAGRHRVRRDADGERVGTLLVHDANLGRTPWRAAAPTWWSAATCTTSSARNRSRGRTAGSVTGPRPAPPAARPTPSPSGPSRAARRGLPAHLPRGRADRGPVARPVTVERLDGHRVRRPGGGPRPALTGRRAQTDEPGPTGWVRAHLMSADIAPRRWRDLNPREGLALNPLSRRAP